MVHGQSETVGAQALGLCADAFQIGPAPRHRGRACWRKWARSLEEGPMTWNKRHIESAEVKELARRTASICSRPRSSRGATSPSRRRCGTFSSGARLLHNPFLMGAMAEAVERINAAIDSGERILIFGDRDVDGITATVLLHEALVELGAEVAWMLPRARTSTGFRPAVIEKAVEAGTGLLLTVDCGVSNVPKSPSPASGASRPSSSTTTTRPPASRRRRRRSEDPRLSVPRPVRVRRGIEGGVGAALLPLAVFRRLPVPAERPDRERDRGRRGGAHDEPRRDGEDHRELRAGTRGLREDPAGRVPGRTRPSSSTHRASAPARGGVRRRLRGRPLGPCATGAQFLPGLAGKSLLKIQSAGGRGLPSVRRRRSTSCATSSSSW